MNLKTINQFDERRLDVFGVYIIIVRYEFGYLYLCCTTNVKITQVYKIAAALQPSIKLFMLYLQIIILTFNRTLSMS